MPVGGAVHLEYVGHPFVDVGVATACAFAGQADPAALTDADLDALADFIEANYPVSPFVSYLFSFFPNSGYTHARQPAADKAAKRRELLFSLRRKPAALGPCAFCGRPAVRRESRETVPLLTGAGVRNFTPEGRPGLPLCAACLFAVQVLPLGSLPAGGRAVIVHSSDPATTLAFAADALARHRRLILAGQAAGAQKYEQLRYFRSHLLELLARFEAERADLAAEPAGLSVYRFTNYGSGAGIDVHHLPAEVVGFVGVAASARHRAAWQWLVQRGRKLGETARRPSAVAGDSDTGSGQRNVYLEDLFLLPDAVGLVVRRHFRNPLVAAWRGEAPWPPALWTLLEELAGRMMDMPPTRLEAIRGLGDRLAQHIADNDDTALFNGLFLSRTYRELRAALVRLGANAVKRGAPPPVTLDGFVRVFEEGEDLAHQDWEFARDLLRIRILEQLHAAGWHRAESLEPVEAGTSDEEGGLAGGSHFGAPAD